MSSISLFAIAGIGLGGIALVAVVIGLAYIAFGGNKRGGGKN